MGAVPSTSGEDRGDRLRRVPRAGRKCGFPAGDLDTLKPGEYLQGAVAKVYAEERVYVVTVPQPEKYASAQPFWPRIVGGGRRRNAESSNRTNSVRNASHLWVIVCYFCDYEIS